MRILPLTLMATAVFGQGTLDPARLVQPLNDSWLTYNGDYSGRRYSALTKSNAANVNSLWLAWVYRATSGDAPGGGNTAAIKGTPLEINGILYFTLPDHVWALDARSGRETC